MEMLKSFRIEALVDVRSFPGSRRYPHFNKENLSKSLEDMGIQYNHILKLGGRRKPDPHSHNTAWKNKAFQGYADYMETKNFKEGIKELLDLATQKRTAYMCSEAVWWRCHRSLISDHLKANGWEVIHIMDKDKGQEHPYTSPAKVVQGRLFY